VLIIAVWESLQLYNLNLSISMTERLLQFIWQFQYFNSAALQTATGALLQIIQSGQYNTNQGPDFLEARIKVDDTMLVGNIELHINASDWNKHRHNDDANYNNVILHVVWCNDISQLSSRVPVLVLQDRIAKPLLRQYDEWMQQQAFIPCSSAVGQVKELVWLLWKERLLIERLQRKSEYILEIFQQNNHHWEETCWQMLAKNFGVKINAEAFESIAKTIPVSILSRHKNQIITLEALLLGQAGLLECDFREEYPRLLQREYAFLQHKHKLRKIAEPIHFLRMRPATFPTVRLAQLAMLIHHSFHLFSTMKEAGSIKELSQLLNITANDYWHYHYVLDESTGYKKKNLGNEMVNNIIINTVAPILFAYGLYHKDQPVKDRALKWLGDASAEKNSITRGWQQLGIASEQAYDSQSLIELKTQYCDKKKCLDCAVGNALLKISVK
jgi:Protein of unknown function (DUF2851)